MNALLAILPIRSALLANLSQPEVRPGCPPGQVAVHGGGEGGDKVECIDEAVR